MAGVSPSFMACRGLFVEGAPPEPLPGYDQDSIISLCKFDNINGNPHAFPVLAIAYDPAARIAQWVAYRSDAWMASKTDDPFLEQLGRKEFYPDADLRLHAPPIPQQNVGRSYGGGVDRGHLKPSELSQWSAGAWAQTYLATNVVPQDGDLNQGSWRRMEEHWLRWTAAQGGTVLDRPVHFLTGVVYGPGSPQMPGNNNPVRPSHVWHVVIDWAAGRSLAFVAPNDGSVDREANFWDFALSLDALEQRHLGGRSLAPGLDPAIRAQDMTSPGAESHWKLGGG